MVGFDPGSAAGGLAQFAADLGRARRFGELEGRMATLSESSVSVAVDSSGVPTAFGMGQEVVAGTRT
ncbi:hypothetical protein [Nocardia sp. bgisy134]|uniref:hypothetical protein n=1 Tax=unclassified Nocardia TaxID=2637762 RepID=UPI003D761E5F